MLKLLVFAPCERVIVGEDDHLTSMIAILERVTAQLKENIPADALIEMKWSMCALWHRPPHIEGPQTYEQKIQMLRPDGSVAFTALHTFDVTKAHVNFRNVFKMDKFPIGLSGSHILKLDLRKKGDEQWNTAAEYFLEVVHEIVETVDESKPAPKAEP